VAGVWISGGGARVAAAAVVRAFATQACDTVATASAEWVLPLSLQCENRSRSPRGH
jgi:hypothetical protein